MSHHHTPTAWELQITDKCYKRMSLINASACYEPDMKETTTRRELLEKVGPDLLVKVQEVQNQSSEVTAREKKSLESAL
jgi:hypothetical protein